MEYASKLLALKHVLSDKRLSVKAERLSLRAAASLLPGNGAKE